MQASGSYCDKTTAYRWHQQASSDWFDRLEQRKVRRLRLYIKLPGSPDEIYYPPASAAEDCPGGRLPPVGHLLPDGRAKYHPGMQSGGDKVPFNNELSKQSCHISFIFFVFRLLRFVKKELIFGSLRRCHKVTPRFITDIVILKHNADADYENATFMCNVITAMPMLNEVDTIRIRLNFSSIR